MFSKRFEKDPNVVYSRQETILVDQQGHVRISDEDIERIAHRITELLANRVYHVPHIGAWIGPDPTRVEALKQAVLLQRFIGKPTTSMQREYWKERSLMADILLRAEKFEAYLREGKGL